MSLVSPEEFRQGLLRPIPLPVGFKRQNPKAFRYRPYSNKARRWLDIYRPLPFDLWLLLEWDKDVLSVNDRAGTITIPADGNRIERITPTFVSEHADERLVVHLIQEGESAEESRLSSAEGYLAQFSVHLKIWGASEIRANVILLENIEHLLCCQMGPTQFVDPEIRENTFRLIKNHRQTTVGVVVEELSHYDEGEIMLVIAEMLQKERVHSDIDSYPLGYMTQISAYQEISGA